MKNFENSYYYVNVVFIDFGRGPRYFRVEDSNTDMFEKIQSLRKRFPDVKFFYSREIVVPTF